MKGLNMKKASVKVLLATGVYGGFMAAYLSFRHGFPGGLVAAVVATVIYVSVMSVLLLRQPS
jgi:hypothetical protein